MFHILQDALKKILKIPKSWQSYIFLFSYFSLRDFIWTIRMIPRKDKIYKGSAREKWIECDNCRLLWKSSFKFNWSIYDLSRKLKLSEFVYVLRPSSVLFNVDVFNSVIILYCFEPYINISNTIWLKIIPRKTILTLKSESEMCYFLSS